MLLTEHTLSQPAAAHLITGREGGAMTEKRRREGGDKDEGEKLKDGRLRGKSEVGMEKRGGGEEKRRKNNEVEEERMTEKNVRRGLVSTEKMKKERRRMRRSGGESEEDEWRKVVGCEILSEDINPGLNPTQRFGH